DQDDKKGAVAKEKELHDSAVMYPATSSFLRKLAATVVKEDILNLAYEIYTAHLTQKQMAIDEKYGKEMALKRGRWDHYYLNTMAALENDAQLLDALWYVRLDFMPADRRQQVAGSSDFCIDHYDVCQVLKKQWEDLRKSSALVQRLYKAPM